MKSYNIDKDFNLGYIVGNFSPSIDTKERLEIGVKEFPKYQPYDYLRYSADELVLFAIPKERNL